MNLTANEAYKKTLEKIKLNVIDSLDEIFEEINKTINEGKTYFYWREYLSEDKFDYLNFLGYEISTVFNKNETEYKISWEHFKYKEQEE